MLIQLIKLLFFFCFFKLLKFTNILLLFKNLIFKKLYYILNIVKKENKLKFLINNFKFTHNKS